MINARAETATLTVGAMPTVLITGASRGIGRAAAVHLAAAGWDVFAGVRSEQDGLALSAAAPDRISTLELDVTNLDHIAALDQKLPSHLDAVVNNAGIAVGGALETLPVDELRRQLEVNVVGQLATTQAVLPRLRDSAGRVVFISSISGRLASPMLGAYAASKFAIEALADALRVELRPWGIPVILIEPGQIDTDIWRTAPEVLEQTVAAMSPAQRELYLDHVAGMRKAIPRAQKMAAPVAGVANTIERALTAKRPKSRYLTGSGARAASILARYVPTALRDTALAATSGVPRKLASPAPNAQS
jgi:NAD(P)-dependent dehydrogenase (short-subunit alcohol dehydrogenase family)